MKKVLITTTALVLTAGVAYADAHTGVSVSGTARLGIQDPLDALDGSLDTDLGFSSRIRVKFNGSGETDSGLGFGFAIRADNAGGGAAGTAGEVFISGSWGKLAMGDNDGGARTAVGHVDGVGYTGLADLNEIIYVSNAGNDPSVLYSNTVGDVSVYASMSNPGVSDQDSFAIGAKFAVGAWDLALAYEDTDSATIEVGGITIATGVDATHIVAGVNGAVGPATVKFVYGTGDAVDGTVDITQYALSGTFDVGMADVTAFYRSSELDSDEISAYGVGFAQDLGGGASLKGGWANLDADGVGDSDSFELGMNLSF